MDKKYFLHLISFQQDYYTTFSWLMFIFCK